MVFSSLTFLYAFLPLVLILYFAVKNRVWRNCVLLAASLVFYSWGEPKFLFWMLGTVLVAYICGLLIWRFDREKRPRSKKAALVGACVLFAANFFVFKYLNFTLENLGLLLGRSFALKDIHLPIGISFYTFQILSYIIDLYRGKVRVQRNFFWLALYVCFFPQLIAGPIVRYATVEKEIRERQETVADVTAGLKRLVLGLAKKVIIANSVALIAEQIYQGGAAYYGTVFYWIAAVAYSLQIYFDFSGYSDMAIGLGRIFGFHFPENFEHPYISLSVTEFWRRWHISLSTWFRDYIYIPLGGNRVGKPRWILNILIVWGLTGLWHGASWNFLLWGLYYALLLLLEKLLLQRLLDKLPRLFRWAYTAFVVVLGWVLFNLTDFSALREALGVMFHFQGGGLVEALGGGAEILYLFLYIPVGLLCMLPLGRWLGWFTTKLRSHAAGLVLENALYLVLLMLSIVFLLSTTFNPFIYFRF